MLNYLVDLLTRLGHWGYLLVFAGATLESAAMLGLLVPGEALVLAAGFFAAQGSFDLDVLIWVVGGGAALGDSLGYELGRRMGRDAATRYGGRIGVTDERLKRAEAFFERHGGASVLLGRFIGFARALVPFVAGTARMPYRRFLPWNLVGAALWSVTMVLLGYSLGNSWHQVESWIGRASAILGSLLLLAWALHERRRWQHLIPLELLTMVLCICLFGAIAEDVVTGDPLTRLDQQWAVWLQENRVAWLTKALLLWTHLHDPWPLSALGIVLAAWWAWRREWRWLVTLALALPGGAMLNIALKHLFKRARPTLDDPLLMLHTFSFPSGHVAGATLLYGLVCAWSWTRIRGSGGRAAAVGTALMAVITVAFSRMYLGVHYLSDVLGAFAEALAWLCLCLALVHGRLGEGLRERVMARFGNGTRKGEDRDA